MERQVIEELQDAQSLKGALLVILEALDSGHFPQTFFIFHDEWISGMLGEIAQLMKERYSIEVPDSEL